jgi:hypothetical protein
MRLMTSVLDRILDSLAHGETANTRRKRQSAMQRAVMEVLESRVLMSNSAAQWPTDPVSNKIYLWTGQAQVTLSWNSSVTNATQIVLECKEITNFSSNFYSLDTMGGTVNSYDAILEVGAN